MQICPSVDIHNNTLFRSFMIGLAALLSVSCSYLQHFQQQAQYTQIQNKITLSKLDKVNKYTSRTPFHKTYEFEFNTLRNNSYALIFYLSESSFSKSIIKHRYHGDLKRDAIRIDDSRNILATLDKNLPHPDSIIWAQVANHISGDEARDSYFILQEYIRLKLRDL